MSFLVILYSNLSNHVFRDIFNWIEMLMKLYVYHFIYKNTIVVIRIVSTEINTYYCIRVYEYTYNSFDCKLPWTMWSIN